MFLAYTKEIDNLTVILGIDFEKLDPVLTSKKIDPILKTKKEFIAVSERQNKIKSLTLSNETVRRSANRIINRVALAKGKMAADLKPEDYNSGELDSLKNYDKLYSQNSNEIIIIQEELKTCNETLKKKKSELMKSDGVFFNIQKCEKRISDADAEKFKKILKEIGSKKQFLLLDGSVIDDNRNNEYFGKIADKWEKIKCTILGEFIDFGLYKIYGDLTEDQKKEMAVQFESDRIADLTAEEKELEKNANLENALSRSIQERNKLEILGDPDALVKSQELYNSLKVEIERKYA